MHIFRPGLGMVFDLRHRLRLGRVVQQHAAHGGAGDKGGKEARRPVQVDLRFGLLTAPKHRRGVDAGVHI